MPTLASDLDLPMITMADGSRARRFTERMEFPPEVWLVRNLVGYSVWHYEDATAILRDMDLPAAKREAAAMLAVLEGWSTEKMRYKA